MSDKIYLPDNEEKRNKIINELIKGNKTVTLEIEEDGTVVANVVETTKKTETLHPITGKPVLLD